MLSHDERIETARAAIEYITGRSDDEQQRRVPNCPGWTVYNAAAHIGRVGIAWEEMITSQADDSESRARGYERSAARPAGASTMELAAWANAAIDHLVDDADRRCYFSMTGGEGTTGLWAWHAASELSIHRLDVEDALGHPHSLTDDQALDAATYTAHYFLPAMRRVTGLDPGSVRARLVGADGAISGEVTIGSDAGDPAEDVGPGESYAVTVEGAATQVLLAMWGRPHTGVEVTAGEPEVWERWRSLPGEAFQFGTWD